MIFSLCILNSIIINNSKKRKRKKEIISHFFSTTIARKMANNICTILPAVLIVMCGYLSNATAIVILMCVAVGCMGFANSGFLSGYVDISPTLSHLLFAVGNTFASAGTALAPIIVGFIRARYPGILGWQVVFWMCFALLVIGAAVYSVWGTSKEVTQLNLSTRNNTTKQKDEEDEN